MINTFADGVSVVVATGVGKIEYWAAATQREAAVSTVQQLLAPGWTAVLTDRRLTPKQVAALKLRSRGSVQAKIRPMTKRAIADASPSAYRCPCCW
jgi:hypothetical protein